MNKTFVEATEGAINKLITDFQKHPTRFWNERDLHWCLFYYLKCEEVIPEKYATELIRAELPTKKAFGLKRPRRGYYDLAVLDPESYYSLAAQAIQAQDSWEEFYKHVKVLIAIEIKLWTTRERLKSVQEKAGWDIKKLIEPKNEVGTAYFLNFVQLDFNRPQNKKFYCSLRENLYLMCRNKPWSNLRILYVTSDKNLQPESQNWLSI